MFCGIKRYMFECCCSAVTQAYNRFATRLLSCRSYIVQSRRRNPLFRCVMSLLLLL